MNSEMMEVLEMIEMFGIEEILNMIFSSGEFIQLFEVVKGVIAPFMIPALLLGVAHCFFGYKIFRILLSINVGVVGGVLGLILGVVCTEGAGAGAVIGFLLGAALFGVMAWFLYKAFLFIQYFCNGLLVGFVIAFVVSQNVAVGLLFGMVLGIGLGVLVIIFERIIIMAITSLRGGSTIGFVLAFLLVKDLTNFGLWNGLLTALFAVGGFAFQYFFRFGKNPVGDAPRVQKKNINRQEQQMMRFPVLLGIDGLYKGFEFDLNRKLIFGRDEERCNILYPENANGISKIQFEIGMDQGSGLVYVLDQYSSFGTNVNGQKIENNKATFLQNGDILMFGESNVFKVSF